MQLKSDVAEVFGAWRNPALQFDLSLRDPWFRLVAGLQSSLLRYSSAYFCDRGINPVLTPITTRSVSSPMGHGSDSLPVQVDLFDEPVYLSDSAQFCLEMLMRHHPNGVYYAMPSFRGEASDTSHLNEFFHIEAELPGRLEDVIECVTSYLKFITERIVGEHGEAIGQIQGDPSKLEAFCAGPDIPVITFAEATRVLGPGSENYGFFENSPVSLSRLGEERIYRHVGGACWVTHYPEMAVPFYQAIDMDTGTALNADLILGGRETVGAGQRHVDVDALHGAMEKRGNSANQYEWYLRMKRDTPLQTCGFGMGVERYILWLTDHDDIRDIELFVRTRGSRGFA